MTVADRKWITEKLLACGYEPHEVQAKIAWLEDCERPSVQKSDAELADVSCEVDIALPEWAAAAS